MEVVGSLDPGSWRAGVCDGALLLGWVAGDVAAEVGCLVHVVPEAVDVDACLGVEELLDLTCPPLLGVGMEPVWPDDLVNS